MATTSKDVRTVVVSVTKTEMVSVLGVKAKQIGLIDFDPDRIEIKDSEVTGMAFDITFEKDTV